MQLAVTRSNEHSLVKDSLLLFKLDQQHIDMYNKNNFPLKYAMDFFIYNNLKYFDNLVGMEFMIYFANYLKENGVTNIETEIPITTRYGDTSIDIICNIGKEKHSFECKCSKHLRNNKAILQIKKAKTLDYIPHLVVVRNSIVDPSMKRRLDKLDADLIRTPATKEDIIDRMLNIQKQFRIAA